MKPSDIQKEVELTLKSLDKLKKAKAPAGFADQLTKKIIFSTDEIRWVNRTKLALAAMIAMAILNGALMFKHQLKQKDLMLNSIAKQYHLTGDF